MTPPHSTKAKRSRFDLTSKAKPPTEEAQKKNAASETGRTPDSFIGHETPVAMLGAIFWM